MEFRQKFKFLLKTKSFKIFLIIFAIYWIGFIYFLIAVNPIVNKVPGEDLFRDIIWIIYWRWNLDYLIIFGFIAVITIESFILSKLKHKVSDDFLSIYYSPIVTMGFAFLYMVAIDVGVTFFADLGLDGNWGSTNVLWFGMTAQQLYHNFFFWFIPIVIIAGITNQVYIRTVSYTKTFRTFCILMAIYSLNLGFLDAVVCQILWNDWSAFGGWAMGGADPIFAEGWIAHYIIFAAVWFIMDYILKSCRNEIEFMLKPHLTR